MARSSGWQRWAWVLSGMLATAPACGDDGGETGSGETGAEGDGTSSGGDTTTGTANLPEGCDLYVEPSDDDQTAVQEALIDVMTGQTLCLGPGTFTFTRQLTLDADGVTVRGEGGDMTILDFSGQISGGNGMLVTGNDVTIAALQLLDTPGDGIRADNVENITFDGVHVIWPEPESMDNGAYGLYPVQSTGVTARGCLVQGSRDAGVYVGQSSQILVEDNEVRGNVAGIEIENSTDAIVRNNWAHDNTAGILVFNLPGLDIKNGVRTNIYGNLVESNNVPNFGEPGTAVAVLPPGVGIIILAADHNEVADNEVRGNDSMGAVVIAYIEALFPPPMDPEFDIYAEGNWIHDNMFADNGNDPDDLVLLLAQAMTPGPDIVLDGCIDAAKDNADGSLDNCVSDNGDIRFVAADVCGTSMFETVTDNYTCMHEPLPRDF
ncbi:parallel beta-helix domain-containing protein [Paraliomyxa miuraensis]|uniref:parallel beta-helix domain-containing protein n=1 Tax=Paraliomyxa miuraensis TaxID=376150 RepID=UPI00224CD336|nr:parallel beta-helix domain-containing protein [Paraliomyxa miuraensis]MCX4240995.1 right-handed parallel beta-helix repeat-containing protein [Paraliomyxa miuraensis]